MFADMNKKMVSAVVVSAVFSFVSLSSLFAAEDESAAEPAIAAPAQSEESAAAASAAEKQEDVKIVNDLEQLQRMRQEAEILKIQAEIEKSKAEAEKARAEAEKAKTEALEVKGECEKPAREEDEAGYHQHDGFFLRMSPGFGVGGFKVSGDLKASDGLVIRNPSDNGVVGSFSLQLGGEVSKNLSIHADFWSYSTLGDHGQDLYVGITTGGVGLGLTYYFMPHNLYISGGISPAFTAVSVMRDNNVENEHKTRVAYGLNASLTFGKEWWVSKNWGLGIAVKGEYGFAENDDFEVKNGCGVLLFSATFQ